MRIKDFLRFVVVAAIFLFGLFYLSKNLTKPPPKKPDKPPIAQTPTPSGLGRSSAHAAAGGYGLHLALQWQRERDAIQKSAKGQPDAWHQIGAVAGPASALSDAPLPRPPSEVITLGEGATDSPFHLLVEFDSRGAAVRRLVLNKFKQSDRLGKVDLKKDPAGNLVRDENGKTIPNLLELIPASNLPDELRTDSIVLYHYDSENDARPKETLGRINWKLAGPPQTGNDDVHEVSFETIVQGIRVTKTYRLRKKEYHLSLEVKLQRTTDAPKKFRYQLSGAHGLPVEGAWYTSVFRHALIGRVEGKSLWRDYQSVAEIALWEGGDEVARRPDRKLRYAGVAVQYFASIVAVDDEQDHQDFLVSARPTLETRVISVEVEEPIRSTDRRITVVDKKDRSRIDTYLLTEEVAHELAGQNLKRKDKVGLLVAPDANDNLVAVQVLKPGDAQPQFYDDVTVRVNTETVDVPGPNEEPLRHKYLLYNGPVKAMLLGQMRGVEAVEDGLVDRYVENLHLNTLTDYHTPGAMGTFASKIWLTNLIILFTNLCHRILYWLHLIIPSYGICIILLTVIVRGMMFPLSKKQAMTGMKMQELAPELKKLKEKLKDDRQAFAMAQMELFRKHGVNPLGSCWMLFLQLPIFMGLYYCLQESVHFRLAPFLWISNLAAPDMLVWWTENIPVLSRPEDYGGLLYLGPYLNILPIIAVTLMIYQQKVLMPPPADEQQAMQMKIMKYMMIFFGLFFYKVAAGLCIYFIASSLWGFAERKWLPKKKTPGSIDTADSLYQQMRGETAPAPVREEPKPAANGQNFVPASNRAKRRQERKRQKERGNTPERNEAIVSEKNVPTATEPTGGWWSNLRRRFSDWWQDVLKKASKK